MSHDRAVDDLPAFDEGFAVPDDGVDRGAAPAVDRSPPGWPIVVAVLALVGLVAVALAGRDEETPTGPERPVDLPDDISTAGDLQWATTIPGSAGRSPVVVGEVVVVVTDDGTAVGLERDSGAVRWRADAAGPDPAEPVVLGPFVVTTAATSVVAVRAVDGRSGWSLTVPAPVSAAPVVVGSRLVVTMRNGEVWGVDGHRGERRWARALDGPIGVAAAADSRTVVVAAGRTVHALEAGRGAVTWSDTTDGEVAAVGIGRGIAFGVARDGSIVSSAGWRARAGGEVVALPAVVGDVAVFATTAGRVHAIDVDDGAARWTRAASSPITAPLSARRGAVVVTTEDGWVHRLDPQTGRRLGSSRTGAGGRATVNLGPGPAVFTVDDADVVAALLVGED